MKQIGLDIQPDKYDPAAFWGDVGKDSFLMWHGGAAATGADDLYLNWFDSAGAITVYTTKLNDPAIDSLVNSALQASDPTVAKTQFAALENWQSTYLPILIWGYQFPQIAMTQNVKGYYSRPDSMTRWLENITIQQ